MQKNACPLLGGRRSNDEYVILISNELKLHNHSSKKFWAPAIRLKYLEFIVKSYKGQVNICLPVGMHSVGKEV